MATDPYGQPPVDVAPPAYPIEEVLALLRQAQPAPPPVAPRPGFLDRLGAGLASVQPPGGGGRAGDVFGANFLAGAARGFGGNRVAQRDADLRQQMDTYERGKSQKALETQAQIGALGQNYQAGVASSLKKTAPQKDEKPRVTITPGMAKRYARFRGLEGQSLTRDKYEDVVTAAPPTPGAPKEDRLVQIMGPQGTPIWVRERDAVGRPAAQAARAVTGQERQSLAFYNRGKQALESIESVDEGGRSLEARVSGASLAGQAQLQYAPNFLQSSDQRAYRQAQRAFTEARLRKESGAAIPTAEYENDARTYFAQPGDDEATIEQKRQARQVVLDGLRFGSGKAYDEFYGEAPARVTQPGATRPPLSSFGRP